MLKFSKYHGIGNDFLVIDSACGKSTYEEFKAIAQILCHRKVGVGADGLLFLEQNGDTYDLTVINSDGSVAELCGNGLRCAVAHIVRRDERKALGAINIWMAAKLHACEYHGSNEISVEMGTPSFEPATIGMVDITVPEFVNQPIGFGLSGTAVSFGNPHLVVFTERDVVDEAGTLGHSLEHHDYFPERVNVHFAKAIGRSQIEMATWERGAGLTLACGSGACAVAVAAIRTQNLVGPLIVSQPGGILKIEIDESGIVKQTGPAKFVFEAEIDLEQLEILLEKKLPAVGGPDLATHS